MIRIETYRNGLIDLCSGNKVINRLYLFGSALTPRFNETDSDIDVLVETKHLSPEEKGENLLALWDDLEKLFQRKVDLLTEDSIQNPVLKKEIEQTRKLIYDGQSRQIFV